MALLIQEDLQGLAAGSAVDPQSGDIATPAGRFISQVGQVPELTALEEAFPDVLDAPLHLGLVPWVTHPGRVGDEPSMLGVFQEAPGQAGMQRVSPPPPRQGSCR